jgi:hypothetical protein
MSGLAEGGVDSATAAPDPASAFPVAGSFLDRLVVRLAAEHGVEPQVVRVLGVEVFATFAGARVQGFVLLLVEKRLRATLRTQRAVAGRSRR